MSKNVRNVLIIVFIILVILLTSSIILKMNNFDFKRLEFSDPKQVKKDNNDKNLNNSKEKLPEDYEKNEEELPSEEEMLPNEDDVNLDNNTTSITETNKTNKTTTKQTTTKKVEVADQNGRPSVSTAKFDADINSVKLNPIKTRHTDLDNKVGNIINSITNSSMTNNQKLYAIFRYIIDTSEYGNGIIYEEELVSLVNKYHYNRLDGTIVYNAKKILDSGYGVCDDYTSLFVVMARRLGFDAYFVGGSVKKANGGTTGHAWVNILANGTYYVFDPQIADKRPSQEKYYYGKTDKEITIYKYNNRDSYIKNFNKFKEIAPLKLDVNLSGAVSDKKSVASYKSNIIKNVSYSAYVGDKLNINIKTSGASKYTYNVKVKPDNSYETSLYAQQNDTNTNINLSYSFDTPQEYRFYISLWSGDTGIISEFYFSVYVRVDDRIKDVNVTTTKGVDHYANGDYPYIIFNSSAIKNNSNSTCTPYFSYSVVSSDDPETRNFYNSNRMNYEPGRTYNIKVTATCGVEKFEKTITIKE